MKMEKQKTSILRFVKDCVWYAYELNMTFETIFRIFLRMKKKRMMMKKNIPRKKQ